MVSPDYELNTSTNISQIDLKSGSDIPVPLRMNCNNFGDPLTFHPVSSSGLHFHLPSTSVHD